MSCYHRLLCTEKVFAYLRSSLLILQLDIQVHHLYTCYQFIIMSYFFMKISYLNRKFHFHLISHNTLIDYFVLFVSRIGWLCFTSHRYNVISSYIISFQKKSWIQHKVECRCIQRVAPKIPTDSVRLLLRLVQKYEVCACNHKILFISS